MLKVIFEESLLQARGPQLKVRPRDGEHIEEFDLETLGYDDCELLKPEVVECSELLTTRLG